MSIQEKLGASASHLLAQGEQVHVAFPGRSRNPSWSRVGRIPVIGLISSAVMIIADLFRNPRIAIVATDSRILVTHRSRIRNRVTDMIRQVPRQTQIGFNDDTPWVKTESLGMKVYVRSIYAPEVMLANSKARDAIAPDAS